MKTEVILPKMGLSMEEAQLVTWEKNIGDFVQKGDVIATVETDKAVLDVESDASGYLIGQSASAGDKIAVGGIMAILSDQPEMLSGRIRISPAARRLAQQNGLIVETISGSGPQGRIVLSDVAAAIHAASSQAQSQVREQPTKPQLPVAEGSKRKLSGMRKTIASRLTMSFRDIPQFQIKRYIDMSGVLKLRETLVSSIELSTGARISVTDFIIQAVARSLHELPKINVSYVSDPTGDFIVQHDQVHVGLAVALDEGLIVPVIKRAEEMSLIEIAKERSRLIKMAKEGKLLPDEMTGGTFTVSSLASYQADEFVALVNPPEAGILAVGNIRHQPVAIDESVHIRPMLCLNGSFDHRPLDGADGARFMQLLAQKLESDKWYIF